ncbi:DUF2142 domain-containing protein [Candidatus Binatia bacterium]|nr:DUF2142 domain-containing protein [Candidatus Binatia bacterium]
MLAAVLGMILVVVSPPLYWGDENTHFLHSYRLALLRFDLSRQDDRMTIELPRGIGKLQLLFGLDRLLRERGTGELTASQVLDRMSVEETGETRVLEVASANYPLLGYAPQALGIALARCVTRSVLLQLYAARIANLAAWLLLVWTALRVTPAFKVAFAVVALAPMSMFVATTCSADAMTNGLALLWTAWIVRLALLPSRPRGAIAMVAGLGIALALVKILYGPLVLLILTVPAARFGGPARRGAAFVATAGGMAASAAGWVLLSRAEIASGVRRYRLSDMGEHLAVLSAEPLRVASMVAKKIFLCTDPPWIAHVIASMWGVVEPAIVLWCWLVAVLAAMLADQRAEAWPGMRERALALSSAFIVLAAVALAAFLLWTPADASEIGGFQGRYALPVLPALVVGLCPPRGLRLAARARATLGAVAFCIAAALLAWTIVRGVGLYH